ncbi:hypothetical protein Taro_047858 [Colocasia esculenta]|uniref:Uncharacterized protein n=1 Tax=Colocasia esculenta TaxID=4460 RepID=A0A843WU38_COLES|nr:hypothetical protein [Colocasia esculenta]
MTSLSTLPYMHPTATGKSHLYWLPCSGEFTRPHPRVPVAGPSSVSPTVAAAAGPASVSPPVAAGWGQSTPSPNIVVGPVPEDAVSLQEGSTPQECEEKCTESFSECIPDSLEGAGIDMDEERLLGNSVQHMGCREMATNIHNNESESGCQSRGQHAYKWEKELKRPPTFQEVFDKTLKKKGTDQYISDRAQEVATQVSDIVQAHHSQTLSQALS